MNDNNTAYRVEACTYLGTAVKACGCPTVKNRAYCEEHLWRVYQKGTAVTRRKDIRTADSVRTWESLFNEAVEELIEEGEF